MTPLAIAAAELGLDEEEARELLADVAYEDLPPEAWDALGEIADIKAEDPHLAMSVNEPGPGVLALAPWARKVVNDTAKMLAVIGANRIGKTFLLAWELVAIGLDRHPVIKREPGVRDTVVVVLPDKDSSWAQDISPAVAKLVPAGALDRRCKLWADRGFRVGNTPMIQFANGLKIVPKASTQTGRSQAGGEGLVALYYNEPPTPATFEETLRQATDVSGVGAGCFVRFYTTPFDADQPLEWAEERIRGDGAEPGSSMEPEDQPTGWREYRVPLVPENVPHRTLESIEEQKQRMSKATHAQRIWARWRGPKKDRALSLWTGEQTFTLNRQLRRRLRKRLRHLPGLRDGEELRFAVGIDHGQGPGKQVFVLVAFAGDAPDSRVWVLDTYRNQGETSVQEDVEGFVRVLQRWGLGVLDIARWCGDINAKINDTIAAALRRHEPRWHGQVRKADKAQHSVDAGLHIINDALSQESNGVPRVQVYEGCQEVVGCFEVHKGGSKHEPSKDIMDAVRYAIVELLDEPKGPSFSEVNRKRESAYRRPKGWLDRGDDF